MTVFRVDPSPMKLKTMFPGCSESGVPVSIVVPIVAVNELGDGDPDRAVRTRVPSRVPDEALYIMPM